jgi:hypothetical protein
MYTLLNKKNGKTLKHPSVGLWFTSDLKEAEEMLEACTEYINSINMNPSDFIIINARSGEIIENEP